MTLSFDFQREAMVREIHGCSNTDELRLTCLQLVDVVHAQRKTMLQLVEQCAKADAEAHRCAA